MSAVNSCWINGYCFSIHPRGRASAFSSCLTPGNCLPNGCWRNEWMREYMKDHAGQKKSLGYILGRWAHAPQDYKRAKPGDAHLVHRSLQRLSQKDWFRLSACIFSFSHKVAACPSCPHCLSTPARTNNYYSIISSASHSPTFPGEFNCLITL